MVQGDRERGLQSVYHTLSLPLLPPEGEDSSHYSPTPTWWSGQFFTSCSKVSLSHRVQSFRNRLRQHGSPMGWQVLPSDLIQCGLLPISGPQVLPGACPSTSFPQDHSFLWESTCFSVESSTGCSYISVPLCTSMDWRGTVCLSVVFTTSSRGISAPAPEAPPPPPSSLTLMPAELFLSHSLTHLSQLLPHSKFFPFLSMLSQRHYHHHC